MGSCQKQNITPSKQFPLGIKSLSMDFATSPTQINNNITFKVNVTSGSKYSFQITDFKGEVIQSQGLTADASTETVSINVNKINMGVYDLIFMDIEGNEIKQPLIIK